MALRSRNPGSVLHVELELAKEKASGLRRVGEKLEALLAGLRQLEQSLPQLHGEAREAALSRHAQLRAEALQQRYNMRVQREAMGLWHHGDLDELYPIPAALH
jgi:hypothetical protein